MRRLFLTAILPLLCLVLAIGQYGNEWIDFDKTYFKFEISEDGVYRIPAATLGDAGLGNVPGTQFRLYHLGEEVAIYTSTAGAFGPGDFIEFYGTRNRGEFDRPLFPDPDQQQLNPQYSMFTDYAAYFLTWEDSGNGARITGVENDLSNPPVAETYYLHRDAWLYTDRSIDPRNAIAETPISLSRYQEAEGFASTEMAVFQMDIASSLVVPQGPDAQLEVRLASSTLTSHNIIGLFASDTILYGGSGAFKMFHVTHMRPAGEIAGNLSLQITDHATNGMFSIASIAWTYPRQYDFTGRDLAQFNHQSAGAQYFELSHFAHSDMDPVVYDLEAGTRLVALRNGTVTRFVLPAFAGERKIVVSSQAPGVIRMIDKVSARTFADYSADNAEFIIITHSTLRTGQDVVASYAQYRMSSAGGGYSVNIYNIEDLYDQFGYGISKHPQAIRNFNKMIREHWSDATTVLIIGKGVSYPRSRTQGSQGEQRLLVPTFGQPGSDNLLFTDNGVSVPKLAVGRLPVENQDQLAVYLLKLQEYDQVKHLPQTMADRAWTKNILHMGGGADANQQAQIRNLLDQMAVIASTTPFGAQVTTFSKNSTSVTSQSNSERILTLLREGVSVVKFFGHSSANTLDFQINNPRDWNNKGKYPIFSAMGCRSGDIHDNFVSLSENFVFEPDAGVIAFVAGSGAQYLNTLGRWGKDWYQIFGTQYNKETLGETILASLEVLSQFGDLQSTLLAEQQTLTGDPALTYYATPGPDYLWDYSSVRFSPEIVTVNDTAFSLTADVVNIGTNYPDTVVARVVQKGPDGTEKVVFEDDVALAGVRTSLSFQIPVERNTSGINTFYLTIDALNETEELPDPEAELNNDLVSSSGTEGITFFILDNRARTTWPLEFSIVTEDNFELIATATNAFIKGATFVMEIDTVPEFDSPVKVREYFSGFRGMLQWKPEIQYIPGTVYYWRVSTDNGNDTFVWDTSSFLYQPGSPKGWNQSHYGQFQRDAFDGLQLVEKRRFGFAKTVKNVWIQNAVNDGPVETFNYFVDNTNNPIFYRDWNATDASIFVSVYDTTTGKTVKNPPGGAFGAINPFATQRPVFPFRSNTPADRNALMTFLEDIIPSGYYVVLHTYQRSGHLDYYPEEWEADSVLYGRSIFSVIENIHPESEIRELKKGSVPYTLLYRKDYGAIQEQLALNYDATINADFNIPILRESGALASTRVGPARSWHSLVWAFSEIDAPEDSISVSLYGMTQSGDSELLFSHISTTGLDLSGVDAQTHPYLYLHLDVKDSSDLRTAPQLEYWRIFYEGQPEIVFFPAAAFAFHSDSLALGDSLHFQSTVQNISSYPSETMDVHFSIINRLNQVERTTGVLPALGPGEMTMLEFGQSITDTDGDHMFMVELNANQQKAEVFHFNNIGLLPFYVIADRVAPQLDVTFDGRHLLHGDIISARPIIEITLHDDNAFVPITDQGHFEVFLLRPDQFFFEPVDVYGIDMSFTPSDPASGRHVAALGWRPEFEADGVYTLRVNARDAPGNQGRLSYQITFVISGTHRIANLTVQPNPFREYTCFSFVVTGHSAPQQFTLRIMDVSGKIVREYHKEDLGGVYVGTHSHDIVWDGRGPNGVPVPAGIYFYTIDAVSPDGKEYVYDKVNGNSGKIILLH